MDTYKYIIDKYNIKVGKQYIVEIPNIGRDDMAQLFAELKFNKGAEIGVAMGEYSEVLCKANPDLKLYAIDPWDREAYEPNINPQEAGFHDNQKDFDGNYEKAKKRLKPYNCVLVKKYSLEALKDFEDNSLDFVYIDANHDFPNFINDLHEWLKKVREDGIISGHDYAIYSYKKFNHVKRALDAYARSYRMQPFFIAGAKEKKEGTVRDSFRSWFWVKKEGGLR